MSSERFEEIVSSYADGKATPAELAELEGLMKANASLRREFVERMRLEVSLGTLFESTAAVSNTRRAPRPVRQAPSVGQREPRIELDERLEDEAPLGQPGMRDGEAGLVQDEVAEEEQVEIDRPRAPVPDAAVAAELALHGEQPVEQLPGGELRVYSGRGVQEARLVDHADGQVLQ